MGGSRTSLGPLGGDIDLYRGLADRLRVVHRAQAERIDRERPALVADGKSLSLDHALDVMQSDAARDLLADVALRLEQALARTEGKEPEPFSVGTFPVPVEDKFLDGVLDYYRHELSSRVQPGRLAQAVVTSLATAAGPHGFVDAETAAQRLGPLGARIVAELGALPAPEGARDGSQKNGGKYLGLDLQTKSKVALSRKRDGYLDRMPLVQELMRTVTGAPLRGVKMASVQHLFPSATALYESLFAAGLAPIDAEVGGKFYSANVNTLAFMEARGMVVHMDPAWHDDLETDAEDAVKAMARQELASMFRGVDPRAAAREGRKFLLLDDGGKLIRALHEHYPQYAHLCVAVEQTTRGIQVLDDMRAAGIEVRCPVVNMAQSALKREVESPLIAESVAWHVEQYLSSLGLDAMKPTPSSPKTAVVVGFGATGSALAASLRRHGYDVVVTDTDPAKLAAARAAGYDAAERTEAFARADLLVGATGRGAIASDEWALLKDGCVLANAASGTHELGLRDLDERQLMALDPESAVHAVTGAVTTRFAGQTLAVGQATDDWRLAHRVVRTEGKELLFLRGGAVVNMEHDLPPEYRQVIVAMLLASCFQAMGESEPGAHDLDPEVQGFLRARFTKALAAEGLSLTEPDLDAVQGPWG